MEQVYEIREAVVKLFKRYEIFIVPILKFLVGLMVFSMINNIGHGMSAIDIITKTSLKTPFILLMAIVFTIMPLSISYAFMALTIILQFSASYEVAALVGAVLLLILFFYGRIGGKESCLLLATFMGFYFKMPYLVPIIAGLYFGLSSVLPISIGVFLWYFTPFAIDLVSVERPKAASIMDIPANFGQIFSVFLDSLKSNNDWAVTAFVFTLVVVVVYTVSKMTVDFAKEIAVAMGAAVNIVSFIFLSIVTDFKADILPLLFFSLLSAIIAIIVKFFDVALDYQRAERVEFEDDDNYYYVKVIPKVIISQKSPTTRRIRGTRERTMVEEPREDDEASYDNEDYYSDQYSEDYYNGRYDTLLDDEDTDDNYNR